MTTAPRVVVPSVRPMRPRRSLFWPVALVVGVMFTLWCAAPRPIGIGIDLGYLVSNLTRGREILAELLSPDLGFFPQTIRPLIETVQMAIVACVLGCLVALPLAFNAAMRASSTRSGSTTGTRVWKRTTLT